MPDGGLDLDALVAIDVHVHVEQDLHGHLSMDDELLAAASKYFKGDPVPPDRAADRRRLPGAADGRGGLHRRQPSWRPGTRRCPTRRSPRRRPSTPTS